MAIVGSGSERIVCLRVAWFAALRQSLGTCGAIERIVQGDGGEACGAGNGIFFPVWESGIAGNAGAGKQYV